MESVVVRIRRVPSRGSDVDHPAIRWWSVCVRHTEGMAVSSSYHHIAHDPNLAEISNTPWVDTETGCCFRSLGEATEYAIAGRMCI